MLVLFLAISAIKFAMARLARLRFKMY